MPCDCKEEDMCSDCFEPKVAPKLDSGGEKSEDRANEDSVFDSAFDSAFDFATCECKGQTYQCTGCGYFFCLSCEIPGRMTCDACNEILCYLVGQEVYYFF